MSSSSLVAKLVEVSFDKDGTFTLSLEGSKAFCLYLYRKLLPNTGSLAFEHHRKSGTNVMIADPALQKALDEFPPIKKEEIPDLEELVHGVQSTSTSDPFVVGNRKTIGEFEKASLLEKFLLPCFRAHFVGQPWLPIVMPILLLFNYKIRMKLSAWDTLNSQIVFPSSKMIEFLLATLLGHLRFTWRMRTMEEASIQAEFFGHCVSRVDLLWVRALVAPYVNGHLARCLDDIRIDTELLFKDRSVMDQCRKSQGFPLRPNIDWRGSEHLEYFCVGFLVEFVHRMVDFVVVQDSWKKYNSEKKENPSMPQPPPLPFDLSQFLSYTLSILRLLVITTGQYPTGKFVSWFLFFWKLVGIPVPRFQQLAHDLVHRIPETSPKRKLIIATILSLDFNIHRFLTDHLPTPYPGLPSPIQDPLIFHFSENSRKFLNLKNASPTEHFLKDFLNGNIFLPILNLFFLSKEDYLVRNFLLFKAHVSSQIWSRVCDAKFSDTKSFVPILSSHIDLYNRVLRGSDSSLTEKYKIFVEIDLKFKNQIKSVDHVFFIHAIVVDGKPIFKRFRAAKFWKEDDTPTPLPQSTATSTKPLSISVSTPGGLLPSNGHPQKSTLKKSGVKGVAPPKSATQTQMVAIPRETTEPSKTAKFIFLGDSDIAEHAKKKTQTTTSGSSNFLTRLGFTHFFLVDPEMSAYSHVLEGIKENFPKQLSTGKFASGVGGGVGVGGGAEVFPNWLETIILGHASPEDIGHLQKSFAEGLMWTSPPTSRFVKNFLPIGPSAETFIPPFLSEPATYINFHGLISSPQILQDFFSIHSIPVSLTILWQQESKKIANSHTRSEFLIELRNLLTKQRFVIVSSKNSKKESEKIKMEFYREQQWALLSAIFLRVSVVVGPPGTGKTDTTVAAIQLLYDNFCKQGSLVDVQPSNVPPVPKRHQPITSPPPTLSHSHSPSPPSLLSPLPTTSTSAHRPTPQNSKKLFIPTSTPKISTSGKILPLAQPPAAATGRRSSTARSTVLLEDSNEISTFSQNFLQNSVVKKRSISGLSGGESSSSGSGSEISEISPPSLSELDEEWKAFFWPLFFRMLQTVQNVTNHWKTTPLSPGSTPTPRQPTIPFRPKKMLIVTQSNLALDQIITKLKDTPMGTSPVLRLGEQSKSQEALECTPKFKIEKEFNELKKLAERCISKSTCTFGNLLSNFAKSSVSNCESSITLIKKKFHEIIFGNLSEIEKHFDKSSPQDLEKQFSKIATALGIEPPTFDPHSHSFTNFSKQEDFVEEFLKSCECVMKIVDFGNSGISKMGNFERQQFYVKQSSIVAMTCSGVAMKRGILEDTKFDIVIVEEAAKILETESLAFLCRRPDRLFLVGDHKQLAPLVQHEAIRELANYDQSLFLRLQRLGLSAITLSAQGRARPEIADLYRWRYATTEHSTGLTDLPHTMDPLNFDKAVVGLVPSAVQWVNVEPFSSTRDPETNEAEAQWVISFLRYLVALGTSPQKISILTPYKNQKKLIASRVGRESWAPRDVCTTDEFQGSQNDIILISLVLCGQRASNFMRDEGRLTVLTSRARKSLTIFGRWSTFENAPEFSPILGKLNNKNPAMAELTIGTPTPDLNLNSDREKEDGEISSEEEESGNLKKIAKKRKMKSEKLESLSKMDVFRPLVINPFDDKIVPVHTPSALSAITDHILSKRTTELTKTCSDLLSLFNPIFNSQLSGSGSGSQPGAGSGSGSGDVLIPIPAPPPPPPQVSAPIQSKSILLAQPVQPFLLLDYDQAPPPPPSAPIPTPTPLVPPAEEIEIRSLQDLTTLVTTKKRTNEMILGDANPEKEHPPKRTRQSPSPSQVIDLSCSTPPRSESPKQEYGIFEDSVKQHESSLQDSGGDEYQEYDPTFDPISGNFSDFTSPLLWATDLGGQSTFSPVVESESMMMCQSEDQCLLNEGHEEYDMLENESETEENE